MADQYDHLVKGFQEGIHVFPVRVVESLTAEEALAAGRRSARSAVAAALWRDVLGESLDTARVVDVLEITRQAISKRLAGGSLIGFRRGGTTSFPAWQFDLATNTVRPVVREIVGAFRDELGTADPYLIASWAATAQPEDLDGAKPSEWIVAGKDRQRLLEAVRRAAGRLAS